MNIFQIMILLLLSMLLISCDSDSKTPEDTSIQVKYPVPIISEYQINALNKAKGVEDVILKAKEKRDDALMDN